MKYKLKFDEIQISTSPIRFTFLKDHKELYFVEEKKIYLREGDSAFLRIDGELKVDVTVVKEDE